jgi:hypothetical protein
MGIEPPCAARRSSRPTYWVKVPIPVPGQAPVKGEAQKDPTHTAVLGLLLEETLRAEGDEVHLVDPGHKDPEYDDGTAFLIAKLKR